MSKKSWGNSWKIYGFFCSFWWFCRLRYPSTSSVMKVLTIWAVVLNFPSCCSVGHNVNVTQAKIFLRVSFTSSTMIGLSNRTFKITSFFIWLIPKGTLDVAIECVCLLLLEEVVNLPFPYFFFQGRGCVFVGYAYLHKYIRGLKSVIQQKK